MSDLSGLGRILERGKPFPETAAWSGHRRFYDRQGPAAWSGGGVPLFITNNPLLADQVARIVAAILREASPAPLVLELGSGTGRFGYLLARSLKRRIGKFRLVLSDFTQSNLDFMASHPRLEPFLKEGLLDLAPFDATSTDPLRCRSGEEISPASPRPLVVIAHYVLGALPAHVFRWREGELEEALPILRAERDGAEDELVERLLLPLDYEYRAASCEYFADPGWNAILCERDQLEGTTFLFPSAAMGCLDHLLRLSGGRLLLLAADKGYMDPGEMRQHPTPPIVRCGGSLSLPVDFSALGERVVQLGGRPLPTRVRTPLFRVAGYLAGWSAGELPATVQEFLELDRFCPHDLMRLTERLGSQELERAQQLALLRLSRWDPHLARSLFRGAALPPEVRGNLEGNVFPLRDLRRPSPAEPVCVPAERDRVPDHHPLVPVLFARALARLAGELPSMEVVQWGWDERFTHRLRRALAVELAVHLHRVPSSPRGPLVVLRQAGDGAPSGQRCLIWDGTRLRLEAEGCPATARFVRLLEDEFGPCELQLLRRAVRVERWPLGEILALIRLSGFDSQTFLQVSRRIEQLAPTAPRDLLEELRGLLKEGLQASWGRENEDLQRVCTAAGFSL
ncbi:MAG: hypothetical protein HY319_05785 [Armatimonadetes bacterium]|nr:hypothetical protein [Armatimonadota bacterium]